MSERTKLIRREPTQAMVESAVAAIKVEAVANLERVNPESVARAALRAAWDAAPATPELTLMERVERLEREIAGKMADAGLAP